MATNWRQLLTVEPVMFFYAYGLFMSQPVFQQYIYHRLSEEHHFPYNFKEQTSSCGSSLNESMEKLEKKVCFNNIMTMFLFGSMQKALLKLINY